MTEDKTPAEFVAALFRQPPEETEAPPNPGHVPTEGNSAPPTTTDGEKELRDFARDLFDNPNH